MSSYYSFLDRDKKYRCRECGKSKPGNYFISETLCKKCSAKRRIPKSNDPITVGNDIIITERV